MNVTAFERETLRTLAHQYMEIATLPIQRTKMEMWKNFNAVGNNRPMVTIDQIPWHELNYDGSLDVVCTEPLLRSIEGNMRRTLYRWKHFPVDMVVEPFLIIPNCARNTGYGIAIEEEIVRTDQANGVVSHAFKNQLETDEDLDKIKDMVITVDREKSAEWKTTISEIFEGIIPVIQAGGVGVRLQIWDVLAELMGVENIYFDLIDRPEFIHEIMERMTHSVLEGIRQANELELINDHENSCHCAYIYTNELLSDFGAGLGANTKNAWGCSMAQLFTSASPETTKEFEIDYMSKITAMYGMFYYGCCERLDDRLDIVQKLPNVKKISCSPWSNPENFAANLDPKIILSNKPTPATLVTPSLDLDEIGKHITNISEIGRRNKINVEFLLKDISTVNYQPERITQWANTVMKVVEKYS